MIASREGVRPRAEARERRQLFAFGLYAAAAATLLAVGTASLTTALDDDAWLRDHRTRQADVPARSSTRLSEAGASSLLGALLTAKTIGVAAADLEQRIESAAHGVGARTLSSRVDLQDAAAANGALAYVGELELEAASLQPLLYDLEAGTPFLEVADLSIRPTQNASAGERLRVSLAVTARWRPEP